MGDDLMDFFNVRKEFKKVYLKRCDFDEPPPETDQSLHCSDAEWRSFIWNEEHKLHMQAAESMHGTSDCRTVVRSAMSGIEGLTMADTITIPANDTRDDDQDLRKMFNFNNHKDGWKLPIIDIKEKILDLVGGNQIVVLSGPTGCGKSTQVPQYILDKHAMDKKAVNIIVTQPRKIAASSVARRVCRERDWNLGGLVGYQVGLDRGNKSPDTRLLYVTTGILKKTIIAPQVEVRHNAKKSRLTGFVAGLGPKTTWDKPEEEITKVERTLAFYPEHDMEIKFDVNVTNQDINTVNKLRYWVNQMLTKTEDGIMWMTQPKSLDTAQKGITRNLEDLLERERKYEEKEHLPSGHEYRWNMLSPGMRMQSQLADQDKFVYKMIDGVKVSMPGDSKVVMEKLITLYSRADQMTLIPLPSTEVCPACPGCLKMSTPRDIWHHFNSEQHKQVEAMLVQASDVGASSYAGSVTSGR